MNTKGTDRYEYKILSERDAGFSGTFDLAALEATLNSHAQDGWRVIESFNAASLWKSIKSEIVVVLQRERAAE
jgi:Domain of unknown function (DUF4177)